MPFAMLPVLKRVKHKRTVYPMQPQMAADMLSAVEIS